MSKTTSWVDLAKALGLATEQIPIFTYAGSSLSTSPIPPLVALILSNKKRILSLFLKKDPIEISDALSSLLTSFTSSIEEEKKKEVKLAKEGKIPSSARRRVEPARRVEKLFDIKRVAGS